MMISQNRVAPELLHFSVANRYHIGGGLKISWHVKSEKAVHSRPGTKIRYNYQDQGPVPRVVTKEREREGEKKVNRDIRIKSQDQ